MSKSRSLIRPTSPPFIRPSIDDRDGIPIFSASDRYVKNYERIASDHVASMQGGTTNPFIEEELWTSLERSTRELVSRYVKEGDRILDVGVGLGRVLAPFGSMDRYGIDISFDYLRIAQEQGFKVAFSRIEDMPYEDEFFDLIIACDVLEHVIDLHACCLQILRVLRRGGTLIVRVPYLDDMSAYLDESIPYEFIHVRSFDVPSLRILFGKILGLNYVEHTFVAPYLKDALFKIKLLPSSSLAARLAKEATDIDHPLWTLRLATQVSHDEFRKWIYSLRDEKPHLLKELLPELVESLEVNIVFRKPD